MSVIQLTELSPEFVSMCKDNREPAIYLGGILQAFQTALERDIVLHHHGAAMAILTLIREMAKLEGDKARKALSLLCSHYNIGAEHMSNGTNLRMESRIYSHEGRHFLTISIKADDHHDHFCGFRFF